MKSALFPIVSAIAFAASLLAGPALAQSAAEGIVVYNAQHDSLTQAWADAFTNETGIKVTLRNGSDTELGNQIVQEGAASPADVFLTENSPAMALVDNAGPVRPVDADTLAQVPEQFRPGRRAAGSASPRAPPCSPTTRRKLTRDELPKSMLDLADPSWKGRWAASPAGADFQAIVSALLELKGEARHRGLAEGDEGERTPTAATARP